jgi:CHAT domain-containing protein
VDLLQGAVQRHLDAGDELSERLAGLRADLDALYNQLLEGSEGEARSGAAPTQASLLEAEISRLRLQAATLVEPNHTTKTAIQIDLLKSIPTSVPLVTYYILDDEICAFVVERGQVQVFRNLASAATIRPLIQRLGIQWERFRAGMYLVQQHLPRLVQSVQRILNELYQHLWAPLERSFTPQSNPVNVVVVPHGMLHQIPFHALHDGNNYLIDRYAISYAPSATVYALCQERPLRPLHRALVLSSADAYTPFVSLEAQRVAAVFSEVELLAGDDATATALRAALPGPDAVHLACHGLFRADNAGFSALKLEDGWLTALDLLDYNFTGSLVVLSACESGRSRPLPGDELLGLPRALLGAGAATVVVSQWLVQDDAAADLMAHFYRELSNGHNPTAALRSAQLALRQQHPHPYYWAPFVVMGAR